MILTRILIEFYELHELISIDFLIRVIRKIRLKLVLKTYYFPSVFRLFNTLFLIKNKRINKNEKISNYGIYCH